MKRRRVAANRPETPRGWCAPPQRTVHAFVMGDFRRIHRAAIIACHYRAAEWRHKEVELAAHDLLQHLDRTAGIG